MNLTIITPSILRPSLTKTCQSIDEQRFKTWHHIIMVDDPDVNLSNYRLDNFDLEHSNRSWYQCKTRHKFGGHICRNHAYSKIPDNTDYVIYIDDDNYFNENAFNILADELKRLNMPNWGIFPMDYLGKRFCNNNPRKYFVDTSQIYHRPKIKNLEIKFPAIKDYAGDGDFVDWLNNIESPTILSKLPNLVTMPVRSYSRGETLQGNTPYRVVILNKFPDVIKPLLDSIEKFESNPDILLILDGHDQSFDYPYIKTNFDNFIFSRSANIGITSTDKDIILVNDDIRLLEPTFEKLMNVTYHRPQIGIVTPMIDGACGNLYMNTHVKDRVWKTNDKLRFCPGTANDYISFACVYLSRQMLETTGLMDENFVDYGRDDADLSIRAVRNNWKLVITSDVTVRHGSGGLKPVFGATHSTSFARDSKFSNQKSQKYFKEKYPEYQNLNEFPYTGSPEGWAIVNQRVKRNDRSTNRTDLISLLRLHAYGR